MAALPADTPVTIPVPEPIVAMPVLPLVQVPPAEISLNVIVAPPRHTPVPPLMAAIGPTVTTSIEGHPDVPI
jgi:hypothetical protein